MSIAETYQGRRFSTDEVAEARNEIDKAIKDLEGISYETGEDYLLLKWGSLKSWNLHSEKAKDLHNRYVVLGSSVSVMSQQDTTEQKELICKMIDECDGVIQNDWDGDYYTKQQAKDYINKYGAKS
ncbi:hypothetical protein [Pseudarthrobacter sp. ATCC 49987]|uniref:hypothetical protein n=1 Tax=Pseudarthrobacter sp. ATCC 49987 TaxID=2698204 RepID=UPI00136B7D28|nr:hypothetical protein [Pseudarthrobacter sp. ATCC 49987]